MGINLVVIPFHDWKKCEREGFRTRDAHLMQEYEKHPDVDLMLVINRPISLSEIVLLRRNLRPKTGKMVWKNGSVFLTQVSEKVFVLDIFILEVIKPLVMHRDWTSYIFGKNVINKSINLALDFLKIKTNYTLFISAPLFVPIVKLLKPKIFAFDAQDNLLKHAMYKNVKNLQEDYEYCLKNANLVYTNSKETATWFQSIRKDATHIANGVDNNIFSRDKIFSTPVDIKSISAPIVGYAGKMQEMFDVDLVEKSVREFPNTNFVFIGQKLDPIWTEKLWNFPNAFYLGDKKYEFLPQYLASFDICIIPYNKLRQHGVDPIKLYEYMAMGKPIVATNLDGVEFFRDFPQIRISQTDEEFVIGLKYFIEKINKKELIDRQNLPDFCTWEFKANKIINDILRKMA